jgi:limonene-1,2-epoxide hydrolase
MQTLKTFTDFYRHFNHDSIKHLPDIYGEQVEFVDPVGTTQGLSALTLYFEKLLTNTSHCEFIIHQASVFDDNHGIIEWTMHYANHQIKGGKRLSLDGMSKLTFADNKIVFQRDYYDLGAMLYEHIPLFGRLIKWLKHRLEQ